ncbi:hypothetical protein ACE1BH_07200 [Aeromonas jandaei]
MIDTKKIIQLEIQQHFKENLELYIDIKKNKDETKLWLWFLRVFCVTLLAGSVWGTFNFKSYTDEIINERIKLLDYLPTATSYAQTEDWSRSIYLLDKIWEDVINKESIKSDEFKNKFLIDYLWVLASANSTDETFAKYLSKRWAKLSENSDFNTLKMQYYNDEVISLNIMLSEVKYAFDKKHMPSHIHQLERLKKIASSNGRLFYEADISYILGMFYLISGDKKNALNNWIDASKLNPGEYLVSDFTKFKMSYYNHSYYSLFKKLASAYGIKNLESLHESTIINALNGINTEL